MRHSPSTKKEKSGFQIKFKNSGYQARNTAVYAGLMVHSSLNKQYQELVADEAYMMSKGGEHTVSENDRAALESSLPEIKKSKTTTAKNQKDGGLFAPSKRN